MRIALIAPFHSFGGSENQLLLLMRGLQKLSIEFVLFHYNVRSPKLLEELETVLGDKHVQVRLRSVRNPVLFFLDVKNLAKQLKQYECDLAHCWNYSGHIIGGLASKWVRIPCIFSIRGLDLWKKVWQLPFYRLLNRLPNKFVFQSITQQSIVSEREWIPSTKSTIIPNGLERQLLHVTDKNDVKIKIRKELDLPLSHSIILSVGSLRSIKGHDILIEAVRKLHASHPNLLFHVLIVGDGPLRKEYEQSARGLPISFAGFRKDVERFYHAADLYCQPSRSEGLPNAVIEAMCCGLPIVASNVGGMAELVTKENGLLCEPENSESMARNLQNLLDNPKTRTLMGKKSLTISERFSSEKMVTEYISVYKSLL